MYTRLAMLCAGLAGMAAFAEEAPLEVLDLEGNLGDAKKPPEVKPGKYIGEVQSVEAKASDKGNKYYQIKIVVPADQLPEDQQEFYEDGAVFYWNRQLVPRDTADRRTIWNLKELYRKLGLDTNITKVDPNEWMGCSVGVLLKSETYQGQTRTVISDLFPAEEPKPTKATAAPAARRGRGK